MRSKTLTKTVAISSDTHDLLSLVKDVLGVKTYDEALRHVLRASTIPVPDQ